MKIRLLKAYQLGVPGEEWDIGKPIAEQLIRRGIAERVVNEKQKKKHVKSTKE